MRKYGVLEGVLRREFGTVGRFSRESGIPRATLSLLLRGRYGSDEARVIERVEVRLRELRPDLDLSHIWDVSYAWYQKFLLERSVVKNGFRIVVNCRLEEDGRLIIAPSLEGY